MKLAAIWFAFATLSWSQGSTGGLIGDVSGDAAQQLSGISIAVENVVTGFTRSTATDSHGAYRIDDLLPGAYSVTAEHAGYRKTTISGILVEIDRKTRLDFTMHPGRDEASVIGNSSPVQTDDASEGYQLGAGVIEALPLSSRNIIELVTLGPGAIPRQLGGFTHDIINDKQANRGAVALNAPVNGARSYDNRYMLDGGDNTDRNTFAVAVLPPLESVQEFRIVTSIGPAEFSQGGGAVVDVATNPEVMTFTATFSNISKTKPRTRRAFSPSPDCHPES